MLRFNLPTRNSKKLSLRCSKREKKIISHKSVNKIIPNNPPSATEELQNRTILGEVVSSDDGWTKAANETIQPTIKPITVPGRMTARRRHKTWSGASIPMVLPGLGFPCMQYLHTGMLGTAKFSCPKGLSQNKQTSKAVSVAIDSSFLLSFVYS
jgi:hypothetical protein